MEKRPEPGRENNLGFILRGRYFPEIWSGQLEAQAWHRNIIWGRVCMQEEKVAAAISSEHDKEMNLRPLRFHF